MRYHLKRTSPGWLEAENSTEGATANQTHGERQDRVQERAGGSPTIGPLGGRKWSLERTALYGALGTPGLCSPGEGDSWRREDRKGPLPFRRAPPALTSHPTHTALGVNVGRSRGRPSTLGDGQAPATDTDICEAACPHPSRHSRLSRTWTTPQILRLAPLFPQLHWIPNSSTAGSNLGSLPRTRLSRLAL